MYEGIRIVKQFQVCKILGKEDGDLKDIICRDFIEWANRHKDELIKELDKREK